MFTNHHCIELYLKKCQRIRRNKLHINRVFEELVAQITDLRISNLRNGQLLTFWLKLFIHKSSLHQVVCTNSIRKWEEISYISLESSKSSFRKLQIYISVICETGHF